MALVILLSDQQLSLIGYPFLYLSHLICQDTNLFILEANEIYLTYLFIA